MNFLMLAFLSAYAICKIPFNNLKNAYLISILQPILILMAVLSLLIFFLIAIPFVCYRGLLFIYLKLKHGKNFIKILSFLGSTYFISDKEYGTMRGIIYLTCDDLDALEMKMKNVAQTIIENLPEISGSVKKCLGYYYLLKESFTTDDLYSGLSLGDNEAFTEEKLCRYLEQCEITKGPLFQIKLFKNPLKRKTYVILCLIHHSIADGHSLWGVVHKYIFDIQPITLSPKTELVSKQQKALNDVYVYPQLLRGILTDGLDLRQSGPHFALYSEDEVCCIPKIKCLRKEFNCTFDEVMMGLFMFNLCQYMKKHLGGCPKVITIPFAHHIDLEYQRNFRDGYFSGDNLANNSFLLLYHAEDLGKYQNFYDFIKYIRHKSQESIRSMALHITFILTRGLLDFVPEKIYHKIGVHQLNQPTIVFSNVGILDKCTISGNPVLTAFGGMACSASGVYVGYSSYANKLQVVFNSKLYFIKSCDTLKSILDDTVKLIHELYQEIESR